MDAAMLAAGLGGNGNFLERFKEQGWYLDDLILQPVNRLQRAERCAENGASRKTASLIVSRSISRKRLCRCCWRSRTLSRLPQRRLAVMRNCLLCRSPAWVSKRAFRRRLQKLCRSFLAIRKTANAAAPAFSSPPIAARRRSAYCRVC
jgi:hypothetical protein